MQEDRVPAGDDDVDLTALALAADPDQEVADDAVPFTAGAPGGQGLLPEWYMPAPAGVGLLTGWRRRVAWVIVASFLALLAAGLCSTEGVVVPA